MRPVESTGQSQLVSAPQELQKPRPKRLSTQALEAVEECDSEPYLPISHSDEEHVEPRRDTTSKREVADTDDIPEIQAAMATLNAAMKKQIKDSKQKQGLAESEASKLKEEIATMQADNASKSKALQESQQKHKAVEAETAKLKQQLAALQGEATSSAKKAKALEEKTALLEADKAKLERLHHLRRKLRR